MIYCWHIAHKAILLQHCKNHWSATSCLLYYKAKFIDVLYNCSIQSIMKKSEKERNMLGLGEAKLLNYSCKQCLGKKKKKQAICKLAAPQRTSIPSASRIYHPGSHLHCWVATAITFTDTSGLFFLRPLELNVLSCILVLRNDDRGRPSHTLGITAVSAGR